MRKGERRWSRVLFLGLISPFAFQTCAVRERGGHSEVSRLEKGLAALEERVRLLEEGHEEKEGGEVERDRIEEVLFDILKGVLKGGLKGDIHIFGERVPVENQDVRERIEKYILLYCDDLGQISLWIKRGWYFYYAEQELKKNGLPEDFVYLMVAESSILPTPYSRVGAAGMWQFMRYTGERMGLECNMWYDARLDYEKSTAAAIRLLKGHFKDLKDWTLSAASYNMGQGNLERHIETQAETDFWRLSLPEETMNYIPRIVAIKLILERLKEGGIFTPLADLYIPLDFERVEVEVGDGEILDLRKFAIIGGIDYRTIEILNPEFPHTHIGTGKYSIRVPEGTKGRFEEVRPLFEKVNCDRKGGNVYFVTDSKVNTLYRVAERFGLRAYDLRRINRNLDAYGRLKEGTKVYLFFGYP